VTVPPKSNKADRDVWMAAANWSDLEWRTFNDGGSAVAVRKSGTDPERLDEIRFRPQLARFGKVVALTEVEDGWLIGFSSDTRGEALYWFSRNGARNYRISSHHIVQFFALAKVMHALERPNQRGAASGSVIRLTRTGADGPWHAETMARLPGAPETVAVKSDGSLLVTLSNALVHVDTRGTRRNILADAPWPTLYPNSSVLSADQRRLYIGMRQFVGEIDLVTNRLRFLIPSTDLLHKLSKQEERGIRGYLKVHVARPGGAIERAPH
jgi:phosphatidylserine/phosphatidylglycerophosphate/cardiolipin synthase-like enzyme